MLELMLLSPSAVVWLWGLSVPLSVCLSVCVRPSWYVAIKLLLLQQLLLVLLRLLVYNELGYAAILATSSSLRYQKEMTLTLARACETQRLWHSCLRLWQTRDTMAVGDDDDDDGDMDGNADRGEDVGGRGVL